MSASKAVAMLVTGCAIGMVATFAIVESRGTAGSPAPDPAAALRLASLERDLAASRADCARLEAELRVPRLDEPSAAVAPAVTAPPTPLPAAGATTAPVASEATPAEPAAMIREMASDRNTARMARVLRRMQPPVEVDADDKPEDVIAILARVKAETVGTIANLLAGSLMGRVNASHVAAIQDALAAQADPQTRLTLAELLAEITGPESDAALERAAANDAQDGVRAYTADIMKHRKPPVPGLLVTSVTPGSRAEAAGIKVDDIMTSYDGEPLKLLDDLIDARNGIRPSQTVVVVVFREGRSLSLSIKGGKLGVTADPVPPQ